MTTTTNHKIVISLLLIFSLSLALSKSAVNVVMTLAYLTALVLIVRHQDYRRAIFANINQPLVIPLLVYLAVAVIGITYTEKLADGIGITNKIAGLFLAYVMTSVVIDTVRDTDERAKLVDDLIILFITGVLILDTIGLLTYVGIFGQRKFTLPVFPLHVHHIWFANLNAVGVYAALSYFLFAPDRINSKRKMLLKVFLPLAAFSILFSISRTAWLGLIMSGLILTYLYSGKKKVFYLTLVVVVASGLLAYLFIPIVHDRMNLGISDILLYAEGKRETSMGWRFLMWKGSFSMFLSNPIFGIGTGDYVITMQRYIASGAYPESLLQFNQPHNMYLFALATSGLLGLAALLYIFVSVFRFAFPLAKASQDRRQLTFLALAVAVHYLVAGLTDSLFNIFILRFSFAFIMGVCVRKMTLPEPKTR